MASGSTYPTTPAASAGLMVSATPRIGRIFRSQPGMIGSTTQSASTSVAGMYWPRARTGLQARSTAGYTTASLANLASESSGLVNIASIGNAGAFRIYTIALSVPGRVRLYTSTTKRTADVSRARGTDPTGAHGVIIDWVAVTGALTDTVSPAVYAVLEGAPGGIPITIDNLSGSTGTVTMTMTLARTEV